MKTVVLALCIIGVGLMAAYGFVCYVIREVETPEERAVRLQRLEERDEPNEDFEIN